MFEIIFLVVLAAFAIGGIWAYVVSKKVKEEGYLPDKQEYPVMVENC